MTSAAMPRTAPLTERSLDLDCELAATQIENAIRDLVHIRLRRRGAVVAISGGIDSSVVLALCARALGPRQVLALMLPEKESSPDTLDLSIQVAASQGVATHLENITDVLGGARCYERRDEAIRQVIPEFDSTWKCKVVLPNLLDGGRYRALSVAAHAPDGRVVTKRLTRDAYLEIVAATNFKQRTRKMLEYFHADRLHFAVAGTPNRLEYDQGFFVKGGDGLADFKPIAHLYKTQVYQLAEYLDVPAAIRQRCPTTDTYSLPQGQDEFYFSLSHREMDLCLYGKNHDESVEAVASVTGLAAEQVELVFQDIDHKRRQTRYLHLNSLLAVDIPELLL